MEVNLGFNCNSKLCGKYKNLFIMLKINKFIKNLIIIKII